MYKKCENILRKLESERKIKISNYQFPQKQPLKLKLKDMLEDEVDEKYIISDKLMIYYDRKIKQGWRKELHLDNKEISSTICNPARNNINDTFVKVIGGVGVVVNEKNN